MSKKDPVATTVAAKSAIKVEMLNWEGSTGGAYMGFLASSVNSANTRNLQRWPLTETGCSQVPMPADTVDHFGGKGSSVYTDHGPGFFVRHRQDTQLFSQFHHLSPYTPLRQGL